MLVLRLCYALDPPVGPLLVKLGQVLAPPPLFDAAVVRLHSGDLSALV